MSLIKYFILQPEIIKHIYEKISSSKCKDRRSMECSFSGILDDGNALCQACEQSLSSLLMLKDVYRKEIDYVIVSKLIDVCYDVLKITTDAIPDSVNELKQYFISLLMCSAE
ncbi:hypothetical protein AAZV13_07G032350 [Glycine max]